ncbi:MAG TPA: serine hydrolase domain-containing protein, partial [Blastocatellia bacterium]|nr:serine hydrolase domain-containing protein [Blastocatellia bacterium]
MQSEIGRGVFPGAQYVVGEAGDVIATGAEGFAVIEPERVVATLDTIYDLASLTKPLVTTLLAVILRERGLIDFNRPV